MLRSLNPLNLIPPAARQDCEDIDAIERLRQTRWFDKLRRR